MTPGGIFAVAFTASAALGLSIVALLMVVLDGREFRRRLDRLERGIWPLQ
jgi:hypothetical protein